MAKSKNYVYLYDVGDTVDNIEILKQIKIKKKESFCKGYLVKCNICDGKYEVNEQNLRNGKRCPYCAHQKLLVGYNSMWDEYPFLRKYVNENVAKSLIGGGGTKEIEVKCPDCGFTKKTLASNFSRRGFSCPVCGDGVSYGEKFVANFLKNSNIYFETQKTFEWSLNKRYDFYIPSHSMIIEVMGGQHYFEKGKGSNWDGLKKQQSNDKLKNELARENGVEHYVILDYRNGTYSNIMESIKSSIIIPTLGISSVDWGKIIVDSQKSVAMLILENYIDGSNDPHPTCERLGISPPMAIKYLRMWDSLGKCSFHTKRGIKHHRKKYSQIA